MASNFSEIPVVDLTPWWDDDEARANLAQEIRVICHEVGFFVAINHGISSDLVDAVFAQMDEIFALSTEDKQRIDKLDSPHFRGWEAVGSEYTNNQPDIREQIDLWSEHPARSPQVEPHYLRLLGPNQWFPDDIAPGYQDLLGRWFHDMGVLGDELVDLLSLALGLPQGHIREVFGEQRMSLTKLINYPPTPTGQAGVNPHHDAAFLTVLAPGKTPGLQVQNASGQWIAVPIIPDSFVINLGEMLQSMTGNYFVATPHRVITSEARTSAGYFHGPSLDTPLAPLPLAPEFAQAVADSPYHSRAGFMANSEETEAGVPAMSSTHRPDVYGEQLWNYFARSYPKNMAKHHTDT